jgi:capsular exopolysaccharide synthesis family protein
MPNIDPPYLPPSQPPSGAGSISDLHGIIRLVRDKSWLIVSCVVLAGIAAAAFVKWAPRVYEAVTTVQVEQEDAKIVKAEQVVSEDMHGLEILNTIVQKMGNPALLRRVLEANRLLPPEETDPTNGSKALTREETIKQFARNVKISLVRNTRLIDIAVRNTDPRLAAQLANSLVENYVAEDALARHTTTEDANAFLQHVAERQKKKLEASEQALQDYRKKGGLVSLEQSQDIVTPQLQDLSKRLTQGNANLAQAKGAYQDSLKMSTNVEELLAYPEVATAPDVVQISAEVERHESDFVVVRQRYREKNPKYVVAAASLDGLKRRLAETVLRVRARIQESLRIAYQNALTSQQGLEAELRETETNAMQLGDAAVRFNVLSREVESDKAQFDSTISRLAETAVAAQITPERIRVIQPALVPELPASPRIKLIFALVLLGGLAVGLGISFVVDSGNTSIRTLDEAEHYLALPVLGTIPKLPKAEVNSNKLVATEDCNSAGAEIFRTLRTTLSMRGRRKDRRTLLFTSALPSEGKTFTSVNYAASLARQGLRTLVVDMDLRRPMIEEFFTGKRTPLPGVTDYFLDRKKFDEVCVQHKEISNLFWIPGGSAVPNPLELLTQSDFQQLLNKGLAQFDRIVIDTVPLLPVSDALLLVARVQTVVLVVHCFKTPRKAVQRSVQLLHDANASQGGIVLNLLPNHLFKGHYYYSDYQLAST